MDMKRMEGAGMACGAVVLRGRVPTSTKYNLLNRIYMGQIKKITFVKMTYTEAVSF